MKSGRLGPNRISGNSQPTVFPARQYIFGSSVADAIEIIEWIAPPATNYQFTKAIDPDLHHMHCLTKANISRDTKDSP